MDFVPEKRHLQEVYRIACVSLTVSRFERVADVTQWDALASSGGFYASAAWLRFHESREAWVGSDSDVPRVYLVLRRDEAPVAAASCWIAATPGVLPTITDPWKRYANVPFERAHPLVHCGTPRGYFGRLLIAPSLGGPERGDVVGALLDGLRSLAEERDARSISVGHLPPDEALELLERDPSMVPLFSHSDSSLELPQSFEEYLGRMRHKQRDNAKLAMRHFAEDGLALERRSMREILDVAAPLIATHEQKYGIPVDAPTVHRYLGESLRWFEDRTFCIVRDGRILGVFLGFKHGDALYARANGMDEAAIPKRAAGYSNLSYFEIREAIAERMKWIHYGSGNLEMKARFGCAISLRWNVVWVRGGVPDPVRRALAAEVRKRLATDEEILRRHTLPQLPPDAITRMFADAESLVARHLDAR